MNIAAKNFWYSSN